MTLRNDVVLKSIIVYSVWALFLKCKHYTIWDSFNCHRNKTSHSEKYQIVIIEVVDHTEKKTVVDISQARRRPVPCLIISLINHNHVQVTQLYSLKYEYQELWSI